MKSTRDIVFEEDDLPYEEEIIRNPFSVKHWIRYIDYKKDQPKHIINLICERALRELPGSYKLWYNYLKLRRQQVRDLCITDPEYEDVNSAFERSLVFMHKLCPENAEEFVEYLTSIGRLDDAAVLLANIVNKEDFVSKDGKSKHQSYTADFKRQVILFAENSSNCAAQREFDVNEKLIRGW
ncbi:hypothetical protein HPB50_002912 [Hyalomma asiaticum]|uniref:Uncharacterized protein n=1 Tax=Hyalomma asiaticum TaxID=266040 RepID=A0ACB7TC56_HYAAI|nr:hypothetical protein HPB50_002912 [Hyalomma asiaticum]